MKLDEIYQMTSVHFLNSDQYLLLNNIRVNMQIMPKVCIYQIFLAVLYKSFT